MIGIITSPYSLTPSPPPPSHPHSTPRRTLFQKLIALRSPMQYLFRETPCRETFPEKEQVSKLVFYAQSTPADEHSNIGCRNAQK